MFWLASNADSVSVLRWHRPRFSAAEPPSPRAAASVPRSRGPTFGWIRGYRNRHRLGWIRSPRDPFTHAHGRASPARTRQL